MSRQRLGQLAGAAALAALAALTAVGLWKTSHEPAPQLETLRRELRGVMGTSCQLAVVTRDTARGEQALQAAEAALRRVETRMSTYLDDSEVSRLNRAGEGEEVPLSPETREVLRAARAAYRDTKGAFDVTCRPLLELWREAAKRQTLPSEEELRRARAASNWELIELTETGARKRAATASVDLGGLAKGYGIDEAVAALKRAGALAGLVDVGGDLRIFGRPPGGEAWTVATRNPFGEGLLVSLAGREGAVCTSGNYARFVEIEGRRYSHIVDPRTGRPADAVPSATALAPTALQADVCATALSVLGEKGLKWLPRGVEGMLVLGTAEDYRLVCTPDFEGVLSPAPEDLSVVEKAAVTEATPVGQF